MIFAPLLTTLVAVVAPFAAAQILDDPTAPDAQGPIRYDAIHNATSIVGTWSTGSKAVSTGPGFCDPAKLTFNYPKNTGVSFSFSADNYYEIARYRFNANGSDPTCITGYIAWVHGRYTLNENGSIWLRPFGDGFQQIQDPCAAVSNFIETYNVTEYMRSWRIFTDPTQGAKLHLFEFDGRPVAPMFLVSATPNMFPTQLLRNDSFVTVQRRGLEGEEEEELEKRDSNGAAGNGLNQSRVVNALGAVGLLVVAAVSMAL